MIHEDLLAKVNSDLDKNPNNQYTLAILKVIELHKTKQSVLDGRPFASVLTSTFCDSCNVRYPCQTINKIKEML